MLTHGLVLSFALSLRFGSSSFRVPSIPRTNAGDSSFDYPLADLLSLLTDTPHATILGLAPTDRQGENPGIVRGKTPTPCGGSPRRTARGRRRCLPSRTDASAKR